jgi:2-polyprenyl-3-methyl-5-hydroxy-6-metoxy-1,4-benzoquinol methylase
MTRHDVSVDNAVTGTEFFDTQADRWIGLYDVKPSFKDRLDLFTRGVARVAPPGARILDFGCGPGVISMALAAQKYDVTGVDGAPRMIELAGAEAKRRNLPNATFEVVDAGRIAFAPGSFDAVVCSSVIEYVPDDTKLIADLAAVLRVGGHLLISVPQAESIVGIAEGGLSRLAAYTNAERRRHLTFSLRRYHSREFARTLEAAGFGSLTFTYFESAIPGRLGVALSRWRRVGVMLLVSAQKIA